jgi:hypothetical protein
VRLKLNGTHQLLAYADDVNLLGDNIDVILYKLCNEILYVKRLSSVLRTAYVLMYLDVFYISGIFCRIRIYGINK